MSNCTRIQCQAHTIYAQKRNLKWLVLLPLWPLLPRCWLIANVSMRDGWKRIKEAKVATTIRFMGIFDATLCTLSNRHTHFFSYFFPFCAYASLPHIIRMLLLLLPLLYQCSYTFHSVSHLLTLLFAFGFILRVKVKKRCGFFLIILFFLFFNVSSTNRKCVDGVDSQFCFVQHFSLSL